MTIAELKKQMSQLWIESFKDSENYVKLIFENYFNPDYIEYQEENGSIIASLIGIPYFFKCGELELPALYLCGLSTKEEFRKEGIMSSLIKKINEKIKDKFVFSFLIPADRILNLYYKERGYHNAIYRFEEKYTGLHNFNNDFTNEINKANERERELKTSYYNSLQIEILNVQDRSACTDLINLIQKEEASFKNGLRLIHSEKDLKLVIEENNISGGEIYVCKDAKGYLTGAAFVEKRENEKLIIPALFATDSSSKYKILQGIHEKNMGFSITIYKNIFQSANRSVSKKYYIDNNSETQLESPIQEYEEIYNPQANSQIYGMIRVLDIKKLIKALAYIRNDVSFTVCLKKNRDDREIMLCEIREGNVNFSKITPEELETITDIKKSARTTELSYNEFYDIIFRRKDTDNLIMEAMEIPNLPMSMDLLLD